MRGIHRWFVEIVQVSTREMARGTGESVRKYPRWLRPLALVCSTLLMLALILCMLPLGLVFGLTGWGRRHAERMRRMRQDLTVMWSERGSQAAVDRLREIIAILDASKKLSVVVEPYGKLMMPGAIAELKPLL